MVFVSPGLITRSLISQEAYMCYRVLLVLADGAGETRSNDVRHREVLNYVHSGFPGHIHDIVNSVEEICGRMARERYEGVIVSFVGEVLESHVKKVRLMANKHSYPTFFLASVFMDLHEEREDTDFVTSEFSRFTDLRFNRKWHDWSYRLSCEWGEHTIGLQTLQLAPMHIT